MSRRLVVTGRKKAEFHTMTLTVDTRFYDNPEAIIAGLLPWFPKPAPEANPVDPSDERKQALEEALAWGEF